VSTILPKEKDGLGFGFVYDDPSEKEDPAREPHVFTVG
jgi:hypothetical protein